MHRPLPRPHRPDRGRVGAPLTALGWAVLFALGGLSGVSGAAAPHLGRLSPIASNPRSAVGFTLRLASATAATRVPSTFWGVDIRSDAPFTPDDLVYLEDTQVRTLRFPGGAIAEAYNYTANVREDTGAVQPNGIRNFVSECRALGCQAILELPVEIDSPATDAAYVAFVEHTLGFAPAIWELGNEPALWDDFGRPWTAWGAGGTNATPASYAATLPAIVRAIRSVDPSTPISGIGGTGNGNDAAWVDAVVRAVGPEIQYVSVHSYGGPATTTSQSAFLQAATGSSSVESAVVAAKAAISAACAGCSIGVLVTEMGASTLETNAGWENGFAMAEWDVAAAAEALAAGAATLDAFAFENGYPGSWIPTDAPFAGLAPSYFAYKDVFGELGPSVVPANLTPGVPWMVPLATVGAALNRTLVLANLDSTTTANVSLIGSGFPNSGTVVQYLWSTEEAEPVGTPLRAVTSVVVPPMTIALLTASPSSSSDLPDRLQGVFSAGGNLSDPSTSIHLSWVPAAGSASNFSVDIGTPSAGFPFCSGLDRHASVNGLSAGLIVTGLLPLTNYCMGARAWEGPNASLESPFVNVTTGLPAPTELRVTDTGSTSVSLAWRGPPISPPATIENYSILSGTSCASLSRTGYTGPGVTSITVQGLRPGTSYCFEVVAWDANGPGAPSLPVNATTVSGPALSSLAPIVLVGLGAVTAGALVALIVWNGRGERDAPRRRR